MTLCLVEVSAQLDLLKDSVSIFRSFSVAVSPKIKLPDVGDR